MEKININPIQWHEGMLLMPQHFQQSDLRSENLLTYYISHAFPFFWGVVSLEVDEALLTTGVFRPTKLEAIMPDGLLVTTLPEKGLEVNLLPFQDKIGKTPYYIYLCVPHKRGADADVTSDLPRYLSTLSSNIVDMNTGEQPIDVPRLIPNLSLQVGVEPPPHYTWLPLGQVTYDAKSFSLTDYIPPQVSVDPLLGQGDSCSQLAYRLRQKLGYLQQKVQAVGQKVTKDPFFEEIEGVRLKLIAGLLPFEAVLYLGKAHPFQVYQALCGLAGQISGVKYGEMPPRFEPYSHLDIKRSFQQVINYIGKVLDEIEESYTLVPFTLSERLFSLQLQSEWIKDRFVLGARAQPGMSEEDLLNWVNNCVIVTDKYLTLAKDNRVLGASRKLVSEVIELNLVATRGVQLFVVEADPRYIDLTGILCLYNMSDDEMTRPSEVVLYNSNKHALGEGN